MPPGDEGKRDDTGREKKIDLRNRWRVSDQFRQLLGGQCALADRSAVFIRMLLNEVGRSLRMIRLRRGGPLLRLVPCANRCTVDSENRAGIRQQLNRQTLVGIAVHEDLR